MQSAIKFKCVPANLYTDDNCEYLQRIERYVVATFTKLLDTIITSVISDLDLKLLMCRTKIETQEPSVNPVYKEALYYECHVKVNMKQIDGSSVEYYTKKKLIHDLAGLFEGDARVLDIFNVMAVSINLLKHPDHGQQFFLTFRTDTKKDMEFIRKHFNKLVNKVVNISNFSEYSIKCITDAECVVYDNNRDLDLPWFPIKTGFLHEKHAENIYRLLSAKRNITLVTSNRDKYKEYQYNQHIIANRLCVYHCNYETDCGVIPDLKTDVERKANASYEHLGRPIIVEGTGLFIEDTQFPGALTGKFIHDMGIEKFCAMFMGKQAIASSILIEYDGKTMKYYNSNTTGKIANSPRGTNGFGWDNIFVVDTLNKTFSEMTFVEKNKYSMRGKLIESYCK
jgi:non-canonical purine NTP pyrophosphatase (RdgB/HAM1 family)